MRYALDYFTDSDGNNRFAVTTRGGRGGVITNLRMPNGPDARTVAERLARMRAREHAARHGLTKVAFVVRG